MTAAVVSPASGRLTSIQWLLLALIVILAAVLRFIFISANEPHMDELWHLEASTGRGAAHVELPMDVFIPEVPALTSMKGAPPWYAVLNHLGAESHPPLHYLLLHGWREIFGDSLGYGRGLSATLSVLCILAMFDVARLLHGTTVALWASLILALSSAQIVEAQEVRDYPLLILLSLCAAGAMLRIEQRGLSVARIAALWLATVGVFFTHYFGVAAVGAMGIYTLIRLRGSDRVVVVATMAVAALVFAVCWGPNVANQYQAALTGAVPGGYLDEQPDHIPNTFLRLAAVPARLVADSGHDVRYAAVLGGTLFVLPWVLLRRHPQLLLWAIWLPAGVAIAAVMDFTRGERHLTELRQTIIAGPAITAILAAMLADRRPLLSHGVPALIAIACLSGLGLTYDRPNPQFSKIGLALSKARNTSEPVIFYSDPEYRWLSHWLLLGASHYSGVFPRAVVRLDRPADAEILGKLRGWREVWLVGGATDLSPEEIVPGAQATGIVYEPLVGFVAHLRLSDNGEPHP